MPFYEYECANCGHHEEALQSVSDKPLKKCPNCGKNGLKKLMSAPVFRLKGSGWYETDFKSDKENKRNLAGADKDESKSETKAESKAETKAESKADTPKADVPKSGGEKAGKPAGKSSNARAKGKSRPARAPKRPARR